MAMNYGSLVGSKTAEGSIRRWVNYEPTPAEDCLLDAQKLIYSQLRVREMRTVSTIALLTGAETAPLPTGFLDPIILLGPDGEEIILREERDYLMNSRILDTDAHLQVADGRPTEYAIYNEVLNFNMEANAAMNFVYAYYKFQADLSGDAPTNFLTTRYPHMLREACLTSAFNFRKEYDAAAKAEARVVALIMAANAESDLTRNGTRYRQG